MQPVHIIGGGLAGCEAAWQLARRGLRVSLVEQKPARMSPAHTTPLLAELVCSNSLRSDDPVNNAVGLLHQEMRRADSVIQYLSSKYNIPAHKIYLIGLGKDKPVDSNKTSEGRKKNRRVDVHLMTNTTGNAPAEAPNTTPAPTANNNPPSSL